MNTHVTVSDIRHGVVNTNAIVSDIHHNMLKNQEGTDGQNLSVSITNSLFIAE
jgi:hypothetical protein